MARLCERPSCSNPAEVAYGFDARRRLMWFEATIPGEALRAGVLCRRHADSMVVPRGWILDDRREVTPRLFRPPPPAGRGNGAAATRKRRPRVATANASANPPELFDPPAAAGDPDETVALPWVPRFDGADDLNGLLDAQGPLLARAFTGKTRRPAT